MAEGEGAYWRCFHCGSTFDSTEAGRRTAAAHFGAMDDTPTCKIEEWHQPLAEYVRELNDDLAAYRDDDSKVIRAMVTMASNQAAEVRAAEEAGYAKAIRDIKTLLVPMVASEEQWDRSINGRKDTSNVELQQSNKEGSCHDR